MKYPMNNHRKTSAGWRILPSLPFVAGVLATIGCSSTPQLPPPPPTTSAPAPTAPDLIQAGFEVETAAGEATVVSVDTQRRKLTLKRADGSTAVYKAGTNVVNFGQIKAGDEVLATVTEDCAFFVMKGGGTPGAAGMLAVARAPKGDAASGVFIETIDINAKVLDVDREARRVLLQYETSEAKSIKVGPNVDLTNVTIGDAVMIRGTEAMALAVEKR